MVASSGLRTRAPPTAPAARSSAAVLRAVCLKTGGAENPHAATMLALKELSRSDLSSVNAPGKKGGSA